MVKQERQRYILFKIISKEGINFEQRDILKSIWQSVWRYFGMKVANKVGLWLLELNLEENYGIIRCSHETKESIITAITMVREIKGKRVILSPVRTSSTIKKTRKLLQQIFHHQE